MAWLLSTLHSARTTLRDGFDPEPEGLEGCAAATPLMRFGLE